MDVVRKAVGLAGADDAFQLYSDRWDGTLSFEIGDDVTVVSIAPGRAPRLIGQRSEHDSGSGDDHVIRTTTDVWEQLVAATPPPGLSDLVGSVMTGLVDVEPGPTDADRNLALSRFGELLRHAANGSDPTPSVVEPPKPAGTFDAAVGRYVHLDLDGLRHRVYFEEAGEGIGLLCQHTAGADARQWRHLLEDERVTSRFRVIAYDLPYHGKSLPPYGVAWWAQRYSLSLDRAMALPVALSQVLGLDRPVFIGSSIGGMLALDLARHHPDDFRAVISLEGGLRVEIDPDALEASVAGSPEQHGAAMTMIMSPTAAAGARHETRLHYAQSAPGVFAGDIDYYARFHDLRGQGADFDTDRCAVHLLTGEYDVPTVPWTETAAAEIPGASMQIMKGLGHFPMSEDHEQLMPYVLPILDEIARNP